MNNKLTTGQLVQWVNQHKQQIVWMICDDNTKGVVVHSDGLLSIGTISNIVDYPITSFIGTLTMNSSK